MKKVLKKFNRTLSIMLAAAMVLTMVPQTAMPVLAAQEDTQAVMTEEPSGENTAEEAVVGDIVETPENPASDEPKNEDADPAEDQNQEPGENNQTPVIDDSQTPGEDPAENPEEETDNNETSDDVVETPEDVVDPTTDTEKEIDSDMTINAVGDVHTITVTADEDKVEVALPNNGEYTEVEGADGNYVFKVTAKATYKIDSVKYTVGDATSSTDAAEVKDDPDGNNYGIPKSAIIDNVTVTVEASKLQYSVTTNVKVDNTEVTDFTNNETISFSIEGATENNKVEAGEKLTIKAALTDAAKKTHKFVTKKYEMDGKSIDFMSADSIDIQNVTGDVTVTVEVKALESYKVTFTEPENKHDKVAKIKNIMVNDAASETVELPNNNSWELTAVEGSKVSFSLEAADKCIISRVYTIKEGEKKKSLIRPSKDDVYTINSLDANTTVEIEAVLDKSKAGGFSFNVAEGSDKNSARMNVTVSGNAIDTDNTAGTYEAGEGKLTRLDMLIVSFEAADGYTLGDDPVVKLNGEKLSPKADAPAEVAEGTPATPKQYEVPLTAGKMSEITVETDAEESTTAKKFEIKADTGNIELGTVKADGKKIEPSDKGDDKGKYEAPLKTKRVEFTLTATGAYEPVVMAKNNAVQTEPEPEQPEGQADEETEVEIKPYTVAAANGKTTYTYIIPASQLKDVYTVTEKRAKKKISFEGAEYVEVSINGKTITDFDTDLPADGYVQGSKINIKLTAKQGVELTKVAYTVGTGSSKDATVKNKKTADFTVDLTGDTVIAIETEDVLVAMPLADKDGEEVALVSGAYNVAYDGTYKTEILRGVKENGSRVTPETVELLNGKNKIENVASVDAGNNIWVKLDAAKPADVSGKTLTLKVKAEGQEFKYTLKVSKAILKVADIKVNNNKAISQPTDTTKTYKIDAADISKLKTEIADADKKYIKSATIDSNEKLLSITTTQEATEAGAKATIKVFTGEGEGRIEKEVKVTTTALITTNTAAPGVKLLSATDTVLKLSLSTNVKDDAATGKLYYKITAKTTSPHDKLESDVTEYVAKEAASTSQTYKLDLAKDGTTEGQGGKCDYAVTVSLIHAKDSTPITKENESTNVLVESKSKACSFSTQNPAWEANLKLKKGTTTVYTSADAVKIATPIFSNTTTYTEIESEDITDLTDAENGLTFTVESDGSIMASANKNTMIGKHTVQVVAKADDEQQTDDHSMAASKATIVVTVVRGIDSLTVDIPTDKLYKAVNKPATLKAVPVYNEDKTGKNKAKQPKAKKVTWDIVKYAESHNNPEEDESFGDGKVKIKNGTVTVTKDYVIQANAENNMFQIKASVMNTKTQIGIKTVAYSDPIEITNEGFDMGSLVIVDNENTVLAVSKATKAKDAGELEVDATKLNGAEIKVLTAEAPKQTVGQQYNNNTDTNETELLYTNLSYKSSKAKEVSVVVSEDAAEFVVKKATSKPVITVTANDGSKATLVAKLKLGFTQVESTTDLALSVCKISSVEEDDATGEKTYTDGENVIAAKADTSVTQDYAGGAANTFAAVINWKKQDETNYTAINDTFVDYEIKIANGKKLSQVEDHVYFTTDKPEVTLTLKDKANSKSKTYTLKNTNAVTALKNKSNVIKAKASGILPAVSTENERKITLSLEIPKALYETITADNKKAYAYVDVDWSKLTEKNKKDLFDFDNALGSYEYEIKDAKLKGAKYLASVNLEFGTDELIFNQKKCDLKVTVGNVTGQGESAAYKAESAPAAASMKVTAVKKFTFKPSASYTLATRDGGAPITGKASINAEDYSISEAKLLNANFGGKVNQFKKYFEIVGDEDSGFKLKIKSNVSADDLKKLTAKGELKDHLTGFLQYKVDTDKSYYAKDTNIGVTTTVKIKVTIKDDKPKAKYAAETGKIKNKTDASATVAITADKAAVTVKYAALDTGARNTDACIKSDEAAQTALVENGMIKLTMKEPVDLNKKKKVKATVYVIPENSYYLKNFTDEKKPTAEDCKTYGAKVTISLNVEEVKDKTLEEAAEAVTAWAEATKTNGADWLKTLTTETDAKNTVLEKAKDAIDADNIDQFTVAYAKKTEEGQTENDDFTFTAATTEKAGSVEGTLKITMTGPAITVSGNDTPTVREKTVVFNFSIPKKEKTPTVTKVEIKKESSVVTTDSVQAGQKQQYTAEVTGTDLTPGANDTVTWTLTGNKQSGTTISNDGTLSVDENETANTTLTITATSTLNDKMTATLTVTVTAANTEQ